MNETQYQKKLMKKISDLFPSCLVMKNDPQQIQGIPDILILYKNKWGMLEVKLDEDSPEQPNQRYYVDALSEMSFASFINPNNEEEVLGELQRSLGIAR
jgi:hypothetical protein